MPQCENQTKNYMESVEKSARHMEGDQQILLTVIITDTT